MTDVQQAESGKTKGKRAQKQAEQPDDFIINYDEAVALAKQLVKDIKSDQMRLGELADRLQPKYGDKTLARFAKDIRINVATVERWRSVYRKWKGKAAPEPVSATVLKTIQNHPKRTEILKENPNLTVRKARTFMNDYNLAHGKSEAKDEHWQVKLTRNWCKELSAFALGGVRYRHIAPEHLDPIVLQQVMDDDDWDHMLAGWRNCATILNTAADELDHARSLAPPKPMFDDPPAAPGDAAPDEATPDEGTTPDADA